MGIPNHCYIGESHLIVKKHKNSIKNDYQLVYTYTQVYIQCQGEWTKERIDEWGY